MEGVEVRMNEMVANGDDSSLSCEQANFQAKMGPKINLSVFLGGICENVENNGKNGVCEYDKACFSVNGQDPYDKFARISGPMLKLGEKWEVPEKKGYVDMGDQEHGYAVGDFVWGKVRNLFSNYCWWPGQIYDPLDASEYAVKYKREDCMLVAYFGDGSSQLKPFEENFDEMLKHSDSKWFVNGVEKAMSEIARLVELEMSCLGKSKENQIGVVKAENAGIRPGVVVPKGRIGKSSAVVCEPVKLLESVRNVAKGVCDISLFEIYLMKSLLNVFNRTKNARPLAIYQEPNYIEGLEDKNENGISAKIDFSNMVEVPIETMSDGKKSRSKSGKKRRDIDESEKQARRRKMKKIDEIVGSLMVNEKRVVIVECGGVKGEKGKYEEGDEKASHVGYVREKIEVMMSMLENCGGGISPSLKSSLEGEMKVILEKLSTITESS